MAIAGRVTGYSMVAFFMAGIVGCDHVSKQVAADVLAGEPAKSLLFDVVRLSYAENTGSFLSLGAGLSEQVRFLLFVVGAGTVLVCLVVYAIRDRCSGARLFGLGAMVAGGMSNLLDRLQDGRVVDFLNVGIGPLRSGIFNVADVAILAGLCVLMLGESWRERSRVNK